MSLRIGPGEIVLVVGENGAGKTTLAKLICHLYDPTAGRILWNGTDYRDIPLAELRRNISVVFQDHARFPATLRENVAAGCVDARDDHVAIVSALDKVGLGPLADRSPLGLDVPLTKELEGGIDLSGGQWQRLAIARALMRVAPGLVVLDEPTSAIDPQTEHEVLACLRGMSEGRSALIVSHRLGLASIASTIVVPKEGRIVERGHHAELMERGGLYREMFLRQTSGFLAAVNAPVERPRADR